MTSDQVEGSFEFLKPRFWCDAGERMVRAGAAAALSAVGTGAVPLEQWGRAVLVGLGAAAVSLLASLAAKKGGTAGLMTGVRRVRRVS